MVSYPIVIRFFGADRHRARVLFPDFAGSYVTLPFSTSLEYNQLTAAGCQAASEYLAGNNGRPGWIETRLRSGRRVNPPNTQELGGREDDDLNTEADVSLSPTVALALGFHWMRLALELDFADMAKVLGSTPERCQQIETCRVLPNHREKARLRDLQTRSQRFAIRRSNAGSQGEPDDGTNEASNF